MPIVALKDLGAKGVNTDIDSLSLPFTSFSMAVNARFENNVISRGPIFFKPGNLTLNTYPRFVLFVHSLSGNPLVYLGNNDGSISNWSSGVTTSETDVSIPGYLPYDFPGPFTATVVNGIAYVNRPDRVPWFIALGDVSFAELPHWDPSWRCKALRSVAGAVVAINVTKGAVEYPSMVKTSDFTTAGSVPGDWVASPSNSATENVLSDLQEPLIDGAVLRNYMVLYSNHETWLMTPTGDNAVFSYNRVFTSNGVISQNCVVERGNHHYVFGTDDIWIHDGYTAKSIAVGRVRESIFQNMVRVQSHQFFTCLNIRLNEVMFCYVSTDPHVSFPVGGSVGYPGCNRAAVYNYLADTWYFYDLPYVTFATAGPSFTGTRWSELTMPWSSISGSWDSLGDAGKSALLAASPSVPAATPPVEPAIRAFDKPGSVDINGAIDHSVSAPVLLENIGIDWDNEGAHIREYKVVKAIYPEVRLAASSLPLTFYFGSKDYSSSPAEVFSPPMTYDGSSLYKLDYMTSGRFFAFRATYDDTKDFAFTGLDLDIEITGKR